MHLKDSTNVLYSIITIFNASRQSYWTDGTKCDQDSRIQINHILAYGLVQKYAV